MVRNMFKKQVQQKIRKENRKKQFKDAYSYSFKMFMKSIIKILIIFACIILFCGFSYTALMLDGQNTFNLNNARKFKSTDNLESDYIGSSISQNLPTNNTSGNENNGENNSAGLTDGDTQVVGDEYKSTHTSSKTGKVYKNYKQIVERYKKVKLANFAKSDLYNYGCAIVSVSIIASGFGQNLTPIQMNAYYENTLKVADHPAALSHFTGLRCKYVYTNFKNGVIAQLKKGYPVMVHVKANSGRFRTAYGHFFVILDINQDGSQVYVSDPASYSPTRNGWFPISILDDNAFDSYIKME